MKVFQMKKIRKYLNESVPNITKNNKKGKTIIVSVIFKRFFQKLYEFLFLSIFKRFFQKLYEFLFLSLSFYGTLLFLAHLYNTISDKNINNSHLCSIIFYQYITIRYRTFLQNILFKVYFRITNVYNKNYWTSIETPNHCDQSSIELIFIKSDIIISYRVEKWTFHSSVIKDFSNVRHWTRWSYKNLLCGHFRIRLSEKKIQL